MRSLQKIYSNNCSTAHCASSLRYRPILVRGLIIGMFLSCCIEYVGCKNTANDSPQPSRDASSDTTLKPDMDSTFVQDAELDSDYDLGDTTRLNRVARQDGSELLWFSTVPSEPSSYPIMLFLDGSGCKSVSRLTMTTSITVAAGFGVAMHEKRGVDVGDDGKSCSDEFLETNDREQRISDADIVISELSNAFTNWDGRLVIIGASRGVAIVPELALEHSNETMAIVLMAEGGLDTATWLRIWTEKSGRDLEVLERYLAEIEANPDSTQTWLGGDNTWKMWASYLHYRPLDFLVQLEIPIYLVHGGNDIDSPVETAEAVVAEFDRLGKSNLVYRYWPTLDHSWKDPEGNSHNLEVAAEIVAWLQDLK